MIPVKKLHEAAAAYAIKDLAAREAKLDEIAKRYPTRTSKGRGGRMESLFIGEISAVQEPAHNLGKGWVRQHPSSQLTEDNPLEDAPDAPASLFFAR